jgi:lipid-A-disaccharide synthase
MVIAGEPSGDMLAAGLVDALRNRFASGDTSYTADSQPLQTGLAPHFFGAGGPRMKAAGVELAVDMMPHSVIGLSDVVRNYWQIRKRFNQLVRLALDRKPDVVMGVDYGGFNLRFGHAIREAARAEAGVFSNWRPKIVQFVSPQVWASRAGRAYQLAADYDLLLSIIPFEKRWYAKRVPQFRVEFVGHPMMDRFGPVKRNEPGRRRAESPHVLLLPGSRVAELTRHLPVMLGAVAEIRKKFPFAVIKTALPTEALAQLAKTFDPNLELQIGNLAEGLGRADLAIASTGTVTMECAFFGVPAVTLYKTSWSTYQIGKRLVTVKWLTMPNILADREIYPEFVQDCATAENISRVALDLLQNESRRAEIKSELARIISSLGEPGASERAADAVYSLFQ